MKKKTEIINGIIYILRERFPELTAKELVDLAYKILVVMED